MAKKNEWQNLKEWIGYGCLFWGAFNVVPRLKVVTGAFWIIVAYFLLRKKKKKSKKKARYSI